MATLNRRGPGRPKGAKNKATSEIKLIMGGFFDSAEWQASAKERMLTGKAPHLESYFLGLIHGKAKDQVEVSIPKPVTVRIVGLDGKTLR